jgi:hypothetical protein
LTEAFPHPLEAFRDELFAEFRRHGREVERRALREAVLHLPARGFLKALPHVGLAKEHHQRPSAASVELIGQGLQEERHRIFAQPGDALELIEAEDDRHVGEVEQCRECKIRTILAVERLAHAELGKVVFCQRVSAQPPQYEVRKVLAWEAAEHGPDVRVYALG